MQVAFWSNFHGRGTTSNCVATALGFSLNYNVKSLIMHTQYIRSTLEGAFYSEKTFEEEDILKFSDTGIDSLERLVKAGQLSPKDYSSYCNSIIEGRLDLLTGSKKTSREIYSKTVGNTILSILDCASSYYDYIFLDLNSGMSDSITQKVICNSDVIVVNLEQNEFLIKDFFQNYYKEFKEKKVILVIGKYDAKSKCSKKYIKANYDYNDEIFSVPYNVDFLDSFNNHSVKKYFYANNKCVRNEINSEFFKEINLIAQKIIGFSENDTLMEPIGSNNVSSLVKNIFRVG